MKVVKKASVLFVNIIFLLLIVGSFILVGACKSLMTSFLQTKLISEQDALKYFYFFVVKLVEFAIAATGSYFASMVASLLLYIDKYLLESENLDENKNPFFLSYINVYLSFIVGIYLVCFAFSNSFQVDTSIEWTYLFNLKTLWTNLKINFVFWDRTPWKAVIYYLCLIVQIGIIGFFYLYKPMRIIKKAK